MVVVLAVAVAVAGVGWGVAMSPIFDVRTIRVMGNVHLTADRVAMLSGIREGANVLTLSTDRAADAIAENPWVAHVEVRRDLPSTIMVRLREREAVGWVRDSGGVAILSADGIVVDRRRSAPKRLTGLGRVDTAAGLGQTLEPMRAQLSVLGTLPASVRWSVAGVRLANAEVTLSLRDGGRVLFGRPVSLPAKAQALTSVLRWVGESGERVDYIDLGTPGRPVLNPA